MTKSTVEYSTTAVVDLTEKTPIQIMHVDDEPALLKVVKQCLEIEDVFQVDTALSVDEAARKMEKKKFDIVLCDYQMPDRNGLEFLKDLRNRGDNIPFIMFTGKGREEVAINALNLGADYYINKTGNPETVYGELKHSIRRAVKRKNAERLLRESEEKYRSLFENATDVALTMDFKGKITSVNKAAEEYGFQKEEIVGKNQLSFVPKKYWPRLLKELLQIARGKTVENEVEIYTPKGERVAEHRSAPITMGNKVVGVQTILKDITDSKIILEELRSSEERFKVIFEFAPDAYYLNDLKGEFIDGNRAAEKLTGYKREELIRKSFLKLNLLPRRQIPKAAKLLAKNAFGKPTGPDEFVLNRKDGTQVLVEIRTFPVKIRDQTLVLSIARDITERKKTEEELEESRKHFQALFNLLVDPVVIVDGKGKFLEITDRVEEITGFKKEELLGKNFLRTKIVTAKSKAILIKNLAKRMIGIHLAPYEVEVVTKDGRKLPYEINATKIEYKGRTADLVAFRDVSERKMTLSKLKVLNEKLGVVGSLTRHDIRNKLSAVTGNLYLAKQKLAHDHKTSEYLGEIESSCRQIERILDFATTYEQIGAEELTYINVEKSIKEAASLFSELSSVKLVNDCQGLTVLADSLVRQLFYNLIDNSLKHGEKVSQIKVYYKELRKDALKFVYEDDGIGIRKDEKEKIFKEGYGKGTGYGLYLVKKMCDVYGWTIEETGRQGKGVQFTITIPSTRAHIYL